MYHDAFKRPFCSIHHCYLSQIFACKKNIFVNNDLTFQLFCIIQLYGFSGRGIELLIWKNMTHALFSYLTSPHIIHKRCSMIERQRKLPSAAMDSLQVCGCKVNDDLLLTSACQIHTHTHAQATIHLSYPSPDSILHPVWTAAVKRAWGESRV